MSSEVINHYFLQPEAIPDALEKTVFHAYPDEPIRVYAFCDLNEKLSFASSWLVLTAGHLIHAKPDASGAWILSAHAVKDINTFDYLDGISSSRLVIVGKKKELMLAVHFTRRQSRAVGNFQFVAEQSVKRLSKKVKEKALADDFDPGAEYREAMLNAVENSKASLSIPKAGVMLRLLSYLKPHRKAVTLGFIFAFLLTALQLIPPYLTRVLVDDIVRPLEKGSNPNAWKMLWTVIIALASIWASSEFISFLRLRIMSITGEKIAMNLRDTLYAHMQKLSLAFFTSRSTGSLITRVSSDTDRLWDFITFGLIDIVVSVLQIIGVAVALFLQDWRLAVLVIIPLPIMTLMFYFHSKKIQVFFLRIWRKWSAMTAVLSDVIPGVRVVKAFAQEKREVDRFHKRSLAVEQEAEVLHKEWTRFWPSVVMLMHTCSLIVWVVGAPRVMQYMLTHGKEGMPLGVFIAFTGYMWMFWAPVQHLGMMSRTVNRVTTSASRIFEVLDTVPTVVSKPDAKTISRIKGRVAFDDVSFTYDGVRNTLKGVTFDVRPGEMIGLVGPSGGGKTTLVNLICRFYDVKDGSVRVDNRDVRDLELTALRRQIGVVLQEPYLFHGTIAENIAYGSKGVSLKDILAAAKAANAHEFICGFADGYETMVGERGQTLSGGERQRISIARAILHNPRILILDEATSSVDTETEKRIQEALHRLVEGRTTFAIAHRLSTLSSANRLFVMEDGKLAEHGTHKELLKKKNGIYAKLHKTQAQLHAAIAV
ncbi:MAG: ABC transporter ATP-binding protein [Spirochaetes bacterium]|nr:ABC transporter ATP-binding protein [Spirochaetota bacterium]